MDQNELLLMSWVLCGPLVAFLMYRTDKKRSKDAHYMESYWLKGHSNIVFRVGLLALAGPISLLIGIIVVIDYFVPTT